MEGEDGDDDTRKIDMGKTRGGVEDSSDDRPAIPFVPHSPHPRFVTFQ